jgi:hypothetical protein
MTMAVRSQNSPMRVWTPSRKGAATSSTTARM